ncbi:hypothetical protein SAMN05421779_106214 [Insolitispirillum peregrinum]|uniref:DUF2946 domain-containing protein n=2 Tax=Insolitispirillum peregrinum TaxID=80876 RepID=A0A1N7PC43_9PROT|nr:hypothetical protein SAMN05421779_106214 [Insolitispirillum peregrinum]
MYLPYQGKMTKQPWSRLIAPLGSRRFTAWVLCCVLFLQILGPTPGIQPLMQAVPDGVLAICTPDGIHYVSLQDDPSPPAPPKETKSCLFCLPLVAGNGPLPSAPVLLERVQEQQAATGWWPDAAVRPLAQFLAAHHPRAPPVPSVPV